MLERFSRILEQYGLKDGKVCIDANGIYKVLKHRFNKVSIINQLKNLLNSIQNAWNEPNHTTGVLRWRHLTPIRCLKSDKTNGYMWAMSSADTGATLYYWQNSRSGEVLDHMLRHGMQKSGSVYEGAILSDGYGGYESWMKSLPAEQKPQWQVCWAHVRRKFVEASCSSNDPAWSRKMVELIRPLYDIERTLRESKAPPEEVKKKREEQSRPIVEDFFKALVERNRDPQNPPRKKLKDAID